MSAIRQPTSLHQTEDGPKLVSIPAGWFLMGSEDGQDNERPLHRVWVDDFRLAECQVTNAEYAKFVQATGAEAPPLLNDPNFNHPQQPVVAISWFEAVRYCEWLSGLHGGSYRLPSEAEWERAARGGVEGKLFPWGDAPPESLPDYAKRWKNGPETAGVLRSERIRSPRYVCQRARMVQRLVSGRLLRVVAGTQPARAGVGRAPLVARRVVASSY